jgi:hypothetical protein
MSSTGQRDISVAFNPGLKAPLQDLATAKPSWTLIDLSTNTVAAVPRAEITQIPNVSPSAAELQPDFDLEPGHSYLVTVKGIPGCGSDEPLSVKVDKFDSLPGVSTPPPAGTVTASKPTGRYFVISPSKARTDSDIYISGMLTGAHHQSPAYTADIKAQLDYVLRSAHSNVGLGWKNPEIAILPNFDFTASTSRGADGNSVSIGAFSRLTATGSWVAHPILEPGFALQADKYFRAKAPVFRLPIYWVPPVLGTTRTNFYVQPLTGLEVGAYSTLPVAKDYAKAPAMLPRPDSILRPFAGASAYFTVYSTEKKPLFSLQGDFIRRWPIIAEPNYSSDSGSKLTLINIGRNPRDYLTLKLERDLTQFFSFAAEYDYGRLPPLYTLVDRKFTLAIIYKAGFKSAK